MIDFSPMRKKQDTPKVGVGVLIPRNNKILMMLRQGSHRADTWSLPGGHIEIGESLYQTCSREIKEELGIHIDGVERFDFANSIFESEGLHYVTLYLVAKWDNLQEPKNMEPEKSKELQWIDPANPPLNIFSEQTKEVLAKYNNLRIKTMAELLMDIYWERG